ncbi:MAG: hypothetical protein JW395_2384 [Nitrospira sp.]|nr:hypothetical protein [Nitrospira sp.]
MRFQNHKFICSPHPKHLIKPAPALIALIARKLVLLMKRCACYLVFPTRPLILSPVEGEQGQPI